MEFVTILEQELRRLGVIPASHTPAQEPDDRHVYLDKDYYNMPNLDEQGEPDF